MKKAICLILLAMILCAGALPSFAQYRKPISEMSDQELNALIRAQRDKFETYTRRTRALLSSFIGQDISLGKDGLALLNRYFPHTLAAIGERFNLASAGPIFRIKAEDGGGGFGWKDIKDAAAAVFGMVTFGDEMLENSIEQDLFDIFRDQEMWPNDQIEAWAEQYVDECQRDLADYVRAAGDGTGNSDARGLFYAGAALIDLYTSLEAVMEHDRRKELRGYLWPRIPQPGPANGTPDGEPAPQGWIRGRQGGNGSSRGGEVVTVTGGGCVTVTYDENNNPILIIEPCK